MENLTQKQINDFRENTFLLVYGVETPKAVLGLYIEDLKQVKRLSTETKRYQGLLALVATYSYALIYCYGHISIRNNRDEYRKEAVKVLGSLKKVSRNFKSGSRIIEVDDREDKGTKLVYKAFDLIKIPMEVKESKNNNTDTNNVSNTCVAKDEINRLKEELDNKTYKIPKGYGDGNKKGLSVESLEIYIKVSLVALATGARVKEITETLQIETRDGVIYFKNKKTEEKGLILELELKTIRKYIKDIRSYYEMKTIKSDIGMTMRKAIKRLNIPSCGNINDLNTMYKSCLTSSTK